MYDYLINILFAGISLYAFWIFAKQEGFVNEDIFDAYILMAVVGFFLKFILRLDLEYIFLGWLFIFFLFVKLKKWSVKKVGDVAIIPLAVFLYLSAAFNAATAVSGESLFLFGVLGLVLGLLLLLRSKYSFGVSGRGAGMRYSFGTLLSGVSFYLGLILICLVAIIFLAKFSLRNSLIYFGIFLVSLINIIMEVRKSKNAKIAGKRFLNKIKSQLALEKKELEKEERLLEIEDSYKVPGRDDDNADALTDVDEDVSHEVNRAYYSALKRANLQVKKALARIGIGKYGICEKCGKKIDPARLKAYPETTLCLECSKKA